MGKDGIPDRWLPYSPMGSVIPGTRFIACKVPLKDALLRSLPEKERFGPKDLLEAFPKIGLLVDLTNTTRYYFTKDFTDKKIQYEKIFCPGKVIPPNSIIKQFYKTVDKYLASEPDPDAVIVVHCTHGVNRTGYFICRYMIEKLNMSPEEALKNFQMARGHGIERDTYVSDLQNGCKGGNESDLRFVPNQRFGRDRRRDGQRQITNSKRSFHGKISEKRHKQNYSNSSNDYCHDRKWSDVKPGHPYAKNSGTHQKQDDKYSYNWRDYGTITNPLAPSTTPLPQFMPVHHQANHQGSSFLSHELPYPHHYQECPPVINLDSKMHFKRGPPLYNGSKRPSSEAFRPLPKFCYPETSNEALLLSSRHGEGSISNSVSINNAPVGNQMSTSGGGASRGRRGGHGSSKWSGPSGWRRGKGHHNHKFSR